MTQAKNGDKVIVSYIGKLKDGTVFDRSPEKKPFLFKLGGGEMIPELETHIVGMKPGESKKMELPPEKAFGQPRREFIVDIPIERLPKEKIPGKGESLQVDIGGKTVVARVMDITDDTVTVDANHPLAGQTLYFELKLESIES